MKINKPYVWVDQSDTSSPIVKFIVKLEDGYGINPDQVDTEIQDTTLYLKYTIDDFSGQYETTPVEFDLQTYSGIDKVVVEIHSDGRMLGFHVVKPYDGNFAVSGTPPISQPYIFTQSIAADDLILYIAVYLPEPARYSLSLNEDLPNFIQYVNLTYTREPNGDGGGGWDYREIPLNRTTQFDPVLEDILVEVKVIDVGGGNEKKGHGTTHGSEGDASGEG